MRRAELSYFLPEELIADRPRPERDGARMLVVEPPGLSPELVHAQVRELDQWLPAGALLVVNDTRVLPARLLGTKAGSGGKVEIFLVEKLGEETLQTSSGGLPAERWKALGRASKPLRPGARLELGEGLACVVAEPRGPLAGGLLEVLLASSCDQALEQVLAQVGHMPLPPYMKRQEEEADRERYQTVFARVPGAVAAPTAGLHLSEALLGRLEARGVERVAVTLHVGLGTFQPVTAEDLDEHPMHSERYEVTEVTAEAIRRARRRGAPVIAVGTTVVRTLESAADREHAGWVRAGAGETRLLIQPGYRFQVVDQLLTNFHLPESTLLALVSAFAGRERVLRAYAEAVEARYRFFSYGDAMLLRGRAEPSLSTPAPFEPLR